MQPAEIFPGPWALNPLSSPGEQRERELLSVRRFEFRAHDYADAEPWPCGQAIPGDVEAGRLHFSDQFLKTLPAAVQMSIPIDALCTDLFHKFLQFTSAFFLIVST